MGKDFLTILEDALIEDDNVVQVMRATRWDEDAGVLNVTLENGDVYSISYQRR